MKIRSRSEFDSRLDHDLKWRKQELTTVDLSIQSPRKHQQEIWFRTGVVLLYSHWEGFAKSCARSYLTYLIGQGKSFKHLKPCFKFFAVGEILEGSRKINLANYSMFERTQALFLEPLDQKFHLDPEPFISTKEHQNLNSAEFKALVLKLGIEYLPIYQLREKLIDEQLLKYRNAVAHGDLVHDDLEDLPGTYKILSTKILECLETFRNQLSIAIQDRTYLMPNASTASPPEAAHV